MKNEEVFSLAYIYIFRPVTVMCVGMRVRGVWRLDVVAAWNIDREDLLIATLVVPRKPLSSRVFRPRALRWWQICVFFVSTWELFILDLIFFCCYTFFPPIYTCVYVCNCIYVCKCVCLCVCVFVFFFLSLSLSLLYASRSSSPPPSSLSLPPLTPPPTPPPPPPPALHSALPRTKRQPSTPEDYPARLIPLIPSSATADITPPILWLLELQPLILRWRPTSLLRLRYLNKLVFLPSSPSCFPFILQRLQPHHRCLRLQLSFV